MRIVVAFLASSALSDASLDARVAAIEAQLAQDSAGRVLDARISALEADWHKTQAALDARESELESLHGEVRRLQAMLLPSQNKTVQAAVEPDGALISADGVRRSLQTSATYAAAPAWQVHEFPGGHSCGTTSRMRLKPMTASGVSYSSTVVADSTADLSLLNVGHRG
jgi:hypothetical protein